jgi:thiamine-phosphate pyrophosphorylase
MRPLPRLHAITDAETLGLADFPVRAAAVAAAGSAVALHARDRAAPAARLTAVTRQLLAHARPAEAAVFVNGRLDIALALDTDGVQLSLADLAANTARQVALAAGRPGGTRPPELWIGVSVHSAAEARQAVREGADYLMVGTVYPSATHPGRPATGVELLRQTAQLGRPVVAIGGITPERAREVREAGAWGVAAIGALWGVPDSAQAALDLLAPWLD